MHVKNKNNKTSPDIFDECAGNLLGKSVVWNIAV